MATEIIAEGQARELAEAYANAYANIVGREDDEIFIVAEDETFTVSINGEERVYTGAQLKDATESLSPPKRLAKSAKLNLAREGMAKEARDELGKTLSSLLNFAQMKETGRLGVGYCLYRLEAAGSKLRATGNKEIRRKADVLALAERYFATAGQPFPSPSERSKSRSVYVTYALGEPNDIHSKFSHPDLVDDSGKPVEVALAQANFNNLYSMRRFVKTDTPKPLLSRIVTFCHAHSEAVVSAAAKWLNDEKFSERFDELVKLGRSSDDEGLLEFLQERLQRPAPTKKLQIEGSLFTNILEPYLQRYAEFTGTDSPSQAIETAIADLVAMGNGDFAKWLLNNGRIDQERYAFILNMLTGPEPTWTTEPN